MPDKQAPSTRWKPGQSGNPKGRPKLGETWADAFRAALTPADKLDVVRSLIERAKAGDMMAAKLVMERMDGLPKGSHEVTGSGGGPLAIVRYVPDLDPDGH